MDRNSLACVGKLFLNFSMRMKSGCPLIAGCFSSRKTVSYNGFQIICRGRAQPLRARKSQDRYPTRIAKSLDSTQTERAITRAGFWVQTRTGKGSPLLISLPPGPTTWEGTAKRPCGSEFSTAYIGLTCLAGVSSARSSYLVSVNERVRWGNVISQIMRRRSVGSLLKI